MSKATTSKETTSQDPKSNDTKLQDTRKPEISERTVDGFVLSVDGKLKTRYESAKDATAAGAKLKQSYPVIQIAVYDATERKYIPVEA